jgi:hypothetical protein
VLHSDAGEGKLVYDGQLVTCDCGATWMVSFDAETEPYLVRSGTET